MTSEGTGEVAARFTGYQKLLFVFLSVATFFEGYDFIALTQILPQLRADMGISVSESGWMVASINAGTVLAYLLIRKADGWGRRRVMTVTILGYTLFSFLSGLSLNVYMFTAAQFCARVFLIAEWAISMVYAAEEFPAARRGLVIGVISGFASLGSIVCAGITPMLLGLDLGWAPWRNVYFVGLLPLILLAFARRSLKESRRFAEASSKTKSRRTFLEIMRGPYRDRVLKLALIWGLTYLCTNTVVTFWKEFAQSELAFSNAEVARVITLGAIASMPLIFAVGPLMDKLGRRRCAVGVFLLGVSGAFLSYTVTDPWLLALPMTFAIFGASATLPVLNAFTTELFPTDHRADAFAWSNNLLGRIGYVLSPIAVTGIASVTSWSTAVRLTCVFPLVALALILKWLPETRGRSLEDTSSL